MDATTLKSEFETQMKDVELKLVKTKEELKKLEEYKIKLIGGLETLSLLENKLEEEEEKEIDENISKE
jgi:hypothetical protein